MATPAGQHGPRGPVAMVASRAVIDGMGRMYEALKDEPMDCQVFVTLDEADEWLATNGRRGAELGLQVHERV